MLILAMSRVRLSSCRVVRAVVSPGVGTLDEIVSVSLLLIVTGLACNRMAEVGCVLLLLLLLHLVRLQCVG